MSGVFASAAQPDADRNRKAWLLVGFMWVAFCLNYSDRQVIFSIFPILKSELHFTDAQLGLTGSVFLWVYGLCSPIAGQIGDRFSKRRLVALSLLLWSRHRMRSRYGSVTVDGQEWKDFDARKEWVRSENPAHARYTVAATY